MLRIARLIKESTTVLEETREIYDDGTKKDADDLPRAFHDVAKTLQPAQEALQAVKGHIDKRQGNSSGEQSSDEQGAAEIIRTKARTLCDIFHEVVPVIPSESCPRRFRYQSAAKGEAVEVLMKEILKKILIIAKEPVLNEAQIKTLNEALDMISDIRPSLEEDNKTHSFNNFGSGPQSINLGHGPQNINTGPGPQVGHIAGSVTFHK
jgi:hypothetical protein